MLDELRALATRTSEGWLYQPGNCTCHICDARGELRGYFELLVQLWFEFDQLFAELKNGRGLDQPPLLVLQVLFPIERSNNLRQGSVALTK
jgi:hypothetical protein